METTAARSERTALCTFCPKLCRQVCPVSNAEPREILIPQQKMQMLHQLDAKRVPYTSEYTAPLFGCTGCGHCRSVCALDNEVADTLFEGRAEARERGAVPAVLEDFAERFRLRGQELRQRLGEIVPRDRMARAARIGFHPACDAVKSDGKDITATLAVFDTIGADYVKVIEPGEACLGYPLLAAGEIEAFRQHARKVSDALSPYAKVISSCPGCVFATRKHYARHGVKLGPEVLHIAEFLADSAVRLPETKEKPAAYYHDPCHLGRQLGVYDAPRRILSRTHEIHEFSRNREGADCCGGGGLVPLTMPGVASAAARRRLEEVRESGVKRVVTACATCKRTLRKEAGDIEILDLAEAVKGL